MYTIQNPAEKAMNGMSQAAGTARSMMPNIKGPEDPGPTPGGAMMSGLGAMGTTAAIAGTKSGAALMGAAATNPVTLPVAAALGIGAYLLS